MQIEQTLHGYDDGHRLLASSAKLDLEEERTLDLLSDLSGYLPAGTDFESYDTGYPCGRFYVLARTWLDRAGRRSGTVFTHSLLVPRNEVAEVSTIAALEPLYMKPSHPVDRDAYRRSISWMPVAPPEPWLPSVARHLLAALWFGQDARPLLWAEPENAAATAVVLWTWLPPWLRAAHTFCTFALQPRYIGPRLFDFLAIAPGAEGLFYSIRDRAVRCDGRAPPPGAGSLVELPWVAQIATGTTGGVQALWNDAVTRGLAPLASSDLRVLLRYRELRARAEANFTAALSCIDLLRRLAPESGTAALEKSRSVWACLEHARGAHMMNRNLLHALDILERDPRNFAPALAPDIGAYLAETLEARAADQPDLALRLWHLAARIGFKEPARDGILDALRRAGATLDADAWLSMVGTLADALLDDDPTAVQIVLQSAPLAARHSLVVSWLKRAPDDGRQLAVYTLEAALELDDLTLVAPTGSLLPPGTLLDAIDRILSRMSPMGLDSIAQLVAQMPPESIANWLVARLPEPALSTSLTNVIVGALADRESARVFFDLALSSTDAVTILVAYSARFGPFEATSLIRSHPDLLVPLLHLAQTDPLRSGVGDLVSEAVTNVDASTLSTTFDPVLVARWERAPWAQSLVQRVVLAVLDDYLAGRATRATLHAWFASSPCQAWFRTGLPLPIEHRLERARGEAAVRAIEALADPGSARLRESAHLVRSCLQAWAEQRTVEIAPLVPAWVALVKSLTDPELRATACGISLQVALDKRDAVLAPLGEVGFATAHQQLMKDASYGYIIVRFLMPFLYDDDWDRAGRMREALAQTWVENSWPPLSLLYAADGDADLFRKLANRAREYSGGKKALRRLWEAARTCPSREPSWDQMLAELPRSAREE